MTRTAATVATLVLLAWALRRARRPSDLPEHDDAYDEPVPMTAWDGTATYDGNSHTVRIRWMPTTTEV